jgi:hypothetical protein
MSTFRNITVDGEVYKWKASQQFVKINGIGLFKTEDVGDDVSSSFCDWCDEPVECGCWASSTRKLYRVTPVHIERLIKQHVRREEHG